MLKIGYLGPKGTFSHEALKQYIKGKPEYAECIECDYSTMPEAILAAQSGEVDEAIVPTENSLEGAINVTLDMLAFDVDLKIKAEFAIVIRQNLMVKKGTHINDIKYILSHPQPIGQCRKYINTNFPNAQVRHVYSTADAALQVANGNGDMAAIGAEASASVYDLNIIAPNIQDGDNNITRFIIASTKDSKKTGNDKTSIVFSTDEDRPGSLYRILDIFNIWGINMTRIESRPTKNRLGRYVFFVDLIGHMDDEDLRDAIIMVRRKAYFFKLLGSYPQFSIE